jgi:hypothetical protein
MSIPVICDRCRATGFAGEADFSHLGDLLEFEPVPRQVERADGGSAEKQRAFIAAVSATGSKRQAAKAVGMAAYGIDQMLKSKGNESFKAAYERAMAIARQNGSLRIASGLADVAARKAHISTRSALVVHPPEPGQVMNESGEWEDQDAFNRRAAAAGASIRGKLLNCRRLYLMEIASSPGQRAAFEILTHLLIDWDKAADLQPQADEPYNICNQYQPDMVLTAESGWSFGEAGYGPAKMAELRQAVNDCRVELGLEPVSEEEWERDSTERSDAGA